ncbi:MAG: DnaJ domain-containing protein [Epsilonproteobacteria bacterium]|nr:DnaJ domain-containing protein [Campylobacterota bacterium]
MDKVFEIEIKDNIEVVIDSRFKLKGFIEFIRLSFNRLEIRDNEYHIYFDKDNIKKHKLLLQTLINMHKKVHKDDTIAKRIALNYRKDVVIKIKKYFVSASNVLRITIRKISSKEFSIEFSKEVKSVYNYIKGLFLFHILEMYNDKLIISFNESSKETVYEISKKNSIMGYKVEFVIDEEEFKMSHRNYSVEGSIKEYLAKIRNALELFRANSIYEFDMIKKEYKRLAKKYHPDLHRDKPELIKKIYEKKFMKIKESYELLEEYYKTKND